MTSFSSLLSTIGAKSSAPAAVPVTGSTNTTRVTSSPAKKPISSIGDRFRLTPSNAAAGVKRKSEEPENVQKAKMVKTEPSGAQNRPIAVPSSRFQLSSKTKSPSTVTHRPTTASASSSNPQKTLPKQPPKIGLAAQSPAPGNGTTPKPKGFLSMLEQAKAAQEASKAANAGGIRHKPVEKLTKKERTRIMVEQKVRQKASKKGPGSTLADRSRSNTPNAASKPGSQAKRTAEPLSYQGTMKRTVTAPLAYKGTMRREAPGTSKDKIKQKGMGQDKYGGYASWSDLSDAEDEDEEEGDYDSDDDMEAGFEDVGMEEEMALRAARKEDQEAQREEEKLKADKAARKRKLQELSRKAAAGKKY